MENNESNSRNLLMTKEQAYRAVDYLVKQSGKRKDLQVTFFGGEPTLNFKVIKDIVEYCTNTVPKKHGKKFVFELITNGTTLSGEIADFVNKHDFLLFVSLDGWREMNNFQRPATDGKDYHETILKNAKYINSLYKKRHARSTVKIRANLTSEYPDFNAVTKYFESHGFTNTGVAGIFDLPGFETPTLGALTKSQLNQMKKETEDLLLQTLDCVKKNIRATSYGMKLLRKSIRILNKRSNKLGIICGAGRNTNATDVDGNIYPCHRFCNMEPYILGNVNSGLDEEKTKSFYRECINTAINNCSECWAREYCKGGCPWDLSTTEGGFCGRPEEMCDDVKKSLELALWLRKELRKSNPEKFKAILKSQGVPQDPLETWKWLDMDELDKEFE